jgi:hypothetical protein
MVAPSHRLGKDAYSRHPRPTHNFLGYIVVSRSSYGDEQTVWHYDILRSKHNSPRVVVARTVPSEWKLHETAEPLCML